MICPKCQKESLNFANCPYCNTPLTTPEVEKPPEVVEVKEEIIEEEKEEIIKPQNTESLRKKLNIFYYIVIGIGIVVLILLIVRLFNKRTTTEPITYSTTTVKETTQYINPINTISNPLGLNNEFSSTIYNEENDKYYDVTLNGIRSLDINEINNILTTNALTYELYPGYGLKGFVYSMTLNNDELDGKNIKYTLLTSFYKSSTFQDFIKIDGENKIINVISIGKDTISNHETVEISVIYQTIDDDYSICFGYREHGIGCIRP